MRSRQLCATAFCAFAVPAVVLLPRAGWLWTAVACLAVAALVLVLHALRGEKSLAEAAAAATGGKAALWALWAWNLLLLGAASRLLCGLYPGGGPIIGLLLLLLAVYAAGKGAQTVLRVSAVSFFFLIGLFALLDAFALPQLHTAWLAPVTQADGTLLPWALVPLTGVWLAREKTKPLGWCLGGGALAVLAALVTAGSLSPCVAAGLDFPFYDAAKSVSVLGAMERLEPLVSAALTAGGFSLLGLLCAVNLELWRVLVPGERRWGTPLNFLAGGTSLWCSGLIPAAILAVGNTIFWGFLPFLPLLIENQKNLRKNQKKC